MKKLIYLEDAIEAIKARYYKYDRFAKVEELVESLKALTLAEPYTEEEIQKMQELEQAEIEKAYELGRQEAEPEIIRCKDCKHHHYFDSKDIHIPYCDKISYGYGWKDDAFCSMAERKDNG